MNSKLSFTRRNFVRTAAISTAATAMTAKSYSQILGANERDLESSHWVSTTCYLANISLKTGLKLSWDAAANIASDAEASAMLERTYREPWAAELKGLLS